MKNKKISYNELNALSDSKDEVVEIIFESLKFGIENDLSEVHFEIELVFEDVEKITSISFRIGNVEYQKVLDKCFEYYKETENADRQIECYELGRKLK
jgi:hypothetical protein